MYDKTLAVLSEQKIHDGSMMLCWYYLEKERTVVILL
jgi:hypothetical protein